MGSAVRGRKAGDKLPRAQVVGFEDNLSVLVRWVETPRPRSKSMFKISFGKRKEDEQKNKYSITEFNETFKLLPKKPSAPKFTGMYSSSPPTEPTDDDYKELDFDDVKEQEDRPAWN